MTLLRTDSSHRVTGSPRSLSCQRHCRALRVDCRLFGSYRWTRRLGPGKRRYRRSAPALVAELVPPFKMPESVTVLLPIRVPEEVDAAPREDCNQQQERSQKHNELGRNVQPSPIRVYLFSAQGLPISVSDGQKSHQSEGQALSPTQIFTFGCFHSCDIVGDSPGGFHSSLLLVVIAWTYIAVAGCW